MRRIAKMAGLCGLLCLILALSGTVNAQQPTATPTETRTPTPVELTLWHSWSRFGEVDLLKKWVTAYQDANPGVTIQTRYFQADLIPEVLDAMRRDQGPDVFIGLSSDVESLSEARRILPLNDRLDAAFKAQVSPIAWQTVTLAETTYGVPINLFTTALFYNQELISAEKLPKTLDDLIAARPDMMFDFQTTAGIYLGLGGTLITPDGVPSVGPNTSALQSYLTLLKTAYAGYRKEGALSDSSVAVVSDRRFRERKTPYLIDGTWKAVDITTDLRGLVQIAPLPIVSGELPWKPLVSSQVAFVNVNALQPDLALRFLSYVTGVAGQSESANVVGRIPVNTAAKGSALTDALIVQANAGLAIPFGKAMPRIYGALDQAVFNVTVADLAPATATQRTVAALQAKP